ncbi:MAG: phospholipase [Pseudonocardia sp.]|nr:phospholipase [Pseudonocardia sp.]
MAGLTRRRLLAAAASSAAVATAAALLPPNVRREVVAPPPSRRASLRDVRHVVLLMQENRSFDHYFGTLAGVRGFGDPGALWLPDGSSVFQQPDPLNPAGHVLPFHLDTRTTSAATIPSTSHEWQVQHDAWNGGRMDGWLAAHRSADGANAPYVMGYHTRADLPAQFALAEAFTVCDAWHASVLGPTWPNRMMWMTGTIDPDGHSGGPSLDNVAPRGGFRWTTYAERLTRAGVSWRVYQQDDTFGCNVLEQFAAFRAARRGSALAVDGLVPRSAFAFEGDALADRLPTVSWIICTSRTSEHPSYRPADGADFVASKIDAIAANPDVWAKTVVIIAYDENDGLFDHVAPPTPPPGTPGEFVTWRSPGGTPGNALPVGAGFRVPAIVVSPWTAGGWVCSEPFDHTSALRLLERVTGVVEPNISAWRRRTFGDLTSVFRFGDRPAAAPRGVRPVPLPSSSTNAWARLPGAHLPPPRLPGPVQLPPTQEPGTRPRV